MLPAGKIHVESNCFAFFAKAPTTPFFRHEVLVLQPWGETNDQNSHIHTATLPAFARLVAAALPSLSVYSQNIAQVADRFRLTFRSSFSHHKQGAPSLKMILLPSQE